MIAKKEELPRWDLTNVYPSLDSQEFSQANKQMAAMIANVGDYLEEHNIDPTKPPENKDPRYLAEVAGGFIELANETLRLSDTISAYIYSFVSTDSFNDAAKKALSEYEQAFVPMHKHLNITFQGWVGQIADLIPEVVKQAGTAREHAFFLKEAGEQSRYMMSPAEEALASELHLSGAGAWGKLQQTITSQLTWEIENEQGVVEKWPMTRIIYLRSHNDETMRRRGYEAELAAWGSVEDTFAACLNGIKGSVNTLNKHRKREDALHASLDDARIDRPSLEAMLEAMKDSFPMFRKYFKAKAKGLGKEKLPWWDVFAPAPSSTKVFTYPEACEFVVDNFAKFSSGLADYAKKAIDHNWIDVGPREGKTAGAFCMGVAGVDESRILLNFDGSFDSVSTLAHELGHGFHNECAISKHELQKITPMTLAETASIMCQTIITDAALKAAGSSDEKLAILENDLTDASQVVVDIYSRYLFEKEVFERRAEVELSAEDFKDIMIRAQKETYGEGLDENYLQPYMWTWKPHYYSAGRSFYNFPYSFGLLFATGLYAIYTQRGADFVPDYVDLLASTGEANAADLAARFGIDIRSKKFWADSLEIIGQRVNTYLAL